MQPTEEDILKLMGAGKLISSGPTFPPPVVVTIPSGQQLAFPQVFIAGSSDQFISHIAAFTARIVIEQLRSEGVLPTLTKEEGKDEEPQPPA